MADILPIRRKTLSNQSINQSYRIEWFLLENLSSLHTKMLCGKYGLHLPCGSGEGNVEFSSMNVR